jgi:hypothetical protein
VGDERQSELAHRVLIERGPRSRRWQGACVLVSLVGLAILVVCGLTGTGNPWDVVGIVLFGPFGVMAFNGAFWSRRRSRSAR